jgi:tetratricopeptide (TPR) repeat protein
MAYVEQARITADPTYYAKADQALARAADLAPDDSVMLTARATLAAARHDFTASLAATGAALRINPYSAAAEAIRSDDLTELGRYAEARRAATRADDLDPGPSTFARLSYQAELRGDLRAATRLMRLSQQASGTSASSYAFATFHLGELARAAGRPGLAAHHYRNALDAEPTYLPALAGQARLAVAAGDLATAERDYRRVVQRLPLTEYVVELGELYEATDRPELAQQQYAVAVASAQLFAANGVATDLETALFQADHGSPAEALAAARAEWDRRQSIHTADALGWALHASGQDRAGLRYATLATRLGTLDARLLFHRGAIEAALGRPSAAGWLRAARRLDAGASPWREAQISTLLGGAR